MVKCWYCGLDMSQDEGISHKIRKGISLKHFPSFEFEEVILCKDCLAKYHKKEKASRYFAIFLLVIILSIFISGLYLALTS